MTELVIDFSGDTINLTTEFGDSEFLISGTGTLTGNYTLTNNVLLGSLNKVIFYFKATVDKASYNFNILGTNLSTTQLNRESTIEAVYNGTSWDLNITPNTKSTGWINFNDLPSDGSVEVIVIPVSFESGEQCFNRAFIPYGFDLLDAWFHVTKAIAGTDDGTILIKGDTGLLRTIVVPASTGLNIAIQATVDNLTQISPESSLDCVTSKTTAGGKGLVSLVVQRYE